MKLKKKVKITLLSLCLLCGASSYSIPKNFGLGSLSSSVKEVAKTMRSGASIIKYGSIIAGALYGIKAAKKGAKAIGTLIPSKCSELITKVPYNLVTETPFKLLEFGKYSLISGLFFGVAYSMHKFRLYI